MALKITDRRQKLADREAQDARIAKTRPRRADAARGNTPALRLEARRARAGAESKSLGGAPENKMVLPDTENKEFDATPAAEELAEELGVDLGSVKGTGADGRITKSDVQAAADR